MEDYVLLIKLCKQKVLTLTIIGTVKVQVHQAHVAEARVGIVAAHLAEAVREDTEEVVLDLAVLQADQAIVAEAKVDIAEVVDHEKVHAAEAVVVFEDLKVSESIMLDLSIRQ